MAQLKMQFSLKVASLITWIGELFLVFLLLLSVFLKGNASTF